MKTVAACNDPMWQVETSGESSTFCTADSQDTETEQSEDEENTTEKHERRRR